MTLIELITVVATASLVLTASMVLALPLMARETLRSAMHHTGAFLQLAKIEAASRNRPCRFVIDTTEGSVAVWDSNGTGSLSDDTLLHQGRLPASVAFTRPGGGAAVTLLRQGLSDAYAVVYAPTGMVTEGTGEVCYHGGDAFGRVSAHAAGGVEISYWDGSQWKIGT